MYRPSFVVLLATYEGASHISEQIESLAAQKGVDLTVVASDDASSDDTILRAQKAARLNKLALHFLPQSGRIGGAAKNFFRLIADADLSNADYVAFCDQDDIWLPTKLSCAARKLVSEGADAYSCNSIAFWPNGREMHVKKNFPAKKWDYLFESASHGCTYALTGKTARELQDFIRAKRVAIEGIEFHDWLVYAWARHNEKRWIYDSEHLIRYRQTFSNAIGANIGWKAVRLRIERLRAGWFRKQSLQIAGAIGLFGDPITPRLGRFLWRDRLYLALRSNQCRRRPRDIAAFVVAVLSIGL